MSTAKAKGTAWESAIVRALSAFFRGRCGLAPRRVAQEGFNDTGDIHGIDPFIGQAKNWKDWQSAIREGLDGAEKQKRAAGRPYAVAFVKRVRKGVDGGYAVMRIDTFARLLMRLRRAEALLDEEALAAHAEETKSDNETPVKEGGSRGS